MKTRYGLTSQETKALGASEFFPLENASNLASANQMKSSALAASLRRLKDRGAIKQQAIFNPFAVGMIPVAIYGQLLEHDFEHKAKLVRHMTASKHLTYIVETLGQYNFYFSILVPSLSRIPCVMRELFEKQGDIFSAKLVAPRLDLILFSKKFLHSIRKVEPQIIVAPDESGIVHGIDELDRKILHQVCNIGFDSMRQIAKLLEEPASTVERRIRRLVAQKVISGFRYNISRNALPTHHARLLLSKKGFCGDTNEKIITFCKQHKNIVRLTRAVGAWDYEISVEVERLSEISCVVNGFHKLCGVRLAHIEVVTELEMMLARPFVGDLRM